MDLRLIITILLGIAIGGVVLSLFAGLFSMGKRHSNLLMRVRIGSQLTAVGLMLLYFLIFSS
jgi:hypothetical protein